MSAIHLRDFHQVNRGAFNFPFASEVSLASDNPTPSSCRSLLLQTQLFVANPPSLHNLLQNELPISEIDIKALLLREFFEEKSVKMTSRVPRELTTRVHVAFLDEVLFSRMFQSFVVRCDDLIIPVHHLQTAHSPLKVIYGLSVTSRVRTRRAVFHDDLDSVALATNETSLIPD